MVLVLIASGQVSSAAEKKKGATAASTAGGGKGGGAAGDASDEKAEAVIEDVNAKQLERLLNDEDYVAVFWCKYSIVIIIVFVFFNIILYQFDNNKTNKTDTRI